MNREVNLTKRVQTPQGVRFCPVVLAKNGRVKPDWVLVNGNQERHEEGAYYIEWRNGAKRVRLSVGKDAADAEAKRQHKEAELNAVNNGVAVVSNDPKEMRRSLSVAIIEYLSDVKLTKKPKTLAAYTTALSYFQESCTKIYLDEIERRDLLKFAAFLRDEKEQAPRSVWNKFLNVVSFLKAEAVQTSGKDGLLKKGDWPEFTEEDVEVYEQEELDAFFKACNEEERVRYEFFLYTGMRDQEVMHVYWKDITFQAGTVRVSHKPDRGWTPKAYKERTIPVPDKLIESLRAWKKQADKSCDLVFPTAGCQPNTHFLEFLKAIAERAGLNRDDFWLHKFRACFATRALRKGTDLRTVQDWMGHKDLESTMRYLQPERGQAARDKANEIWT